VTDNPFGEWHTDRVNADPIESLPPGHGSQVGISHRLKGPV
jgi:hypothetical protein